MVKRTRNDNPAKEDWNVYGNEATVWVDASSLAQDVIVEVDGNIIEDACWLRKDDTTHINMSELEAVIKGINMGLKWKMSILHICTDSKVVFYWVTNALTGISRLRTKASNEMLIRRRLHTITNIVDEYKLRVDIKLVPSESNLADALTRVPGSWLKIVDKPPELAASGTISASLSLKEISHVHRSTGHYGVKRTLYFAREEVRQVVEKCIACQSIDPSPIKWTKGKIEVQGTWQGLGVDITHYEGQHYLTLIDCGPPRYAISS